MASMGGRVKFASSAVKEYTTGSRRPRTPKPPNTTTLKNAINHGAFQLTLASAREKTPGVTVVLMR
jgi:hypothetical protein